jgi:hypothetical protein
MSDLVVLRPPHSKEAREAACNQHAVELLERLLAEAKAGEVLSIAAFVERPGGFTTATTPVAHGDVRTRVGEAFIFAHNLVTLSEDDE